MRPKPSTLNSHFVICFRIYSTKKYTVCGGNYGAVLLIVRINFGCFEHRAPLSHSPLHCFVAVTVGGSVRAHATKCDVKRNRLHRPMSRSQWFL